MVRITGVAIIAMMDTNLILQRVAAALDCLTSAAEQYHGLFGSIINRADGRLLDDYPPAIEGQRGNDRAPRGCNLTHDEPTLMTMLASSDARHVAAADRYLKRFATHCTNTTTGLFPWGEHAFWHLDRDEPANSYQNPDAASGYGLTHDHLRAAPFWLLQKLNTFNPSCLAPFAHGLTNHWNPPGNEDSLEFIRHAKIDRWEPYSTKPIIRSCDFPRHSGFYIFDMAAAYHLTGDAQLLDDLKPFLDYWWQKREPSGICLIESRTENDYAMGDMLAAGQTLSLASSLLDAAELLNANQPELASVMRSRAEVYIEGFFTAPHDINNGKFVLNYRPSDGEAWLMSIWGSVYGKTPASYTALNCLCVYRRTQDPRLLEWACAAGKRYMAEPFPTDKNVPAMDAGLGLGLLADLYDLTRDTTWRDGMLACAANLIDIYFDDKPLPRSASGIDYYDSQSGPGFILHGLLRTAQLADDPDAATLGPDYTGR